MRTPLVRTSCLIALAVALPLFSAGIAEAVVSFDWVTVGDPNNSADTLVMTKGMTADNTTGYGSVGYDFQIAEKHVTNSQYVEFLNGADPDGNEPGPIFGNPNGIYNPNMSLSAIGTTGIAYTGGIDFNGGAAVGSKYSAKSGQENYPATWINWASGARFVNWLHNGQGTGDTENGVYDMSLLSPSSANPLLYPPRQAGATVFMPSEDEFYKAAYYDPTKGGTGGYWEYGVQSNTAPVSEAPSGGATSANYATAAGASGSLDDIYWQNGSTFDDSLDYLTDVGSYTSATSYYGIHDADGLIYQWTEGTKTHSIGTEFPAYRGGGWHDSSERNGAAFRALYSFADAASYAWFGLRLAQPASETFLAADFNEDGDVDDIDLGIWEASYGIDADADANGDGESSGADFLVWQQQYTGDLLPLSAVAASVPEPSSVVLLVPLVAASVLRRQRRCAIY